jgi:two-component system chemotaxis response regulator CheB
MMADYEAVVMGASAGGLSALQMFLSLLPADFGWPILIVLHRAPSPNDLMSFMLNESCLLKVKEADQNEPIQRGFVYLAPSNYHLMIEFDKTIALSIDEKVAYSRPSIDVLFETAADVYRSNLIGIILTGANQDGTVGLKRIKELGGLTIAQDPTTAEVDMMPQAAIRANVVDKVLALPQIASYLTQLTHEGIYYNE